MRIVFKKTNRPSYADRMGGNCLHQVQFWRNGASFWKENGELARSLDCHRRAEDKLKEAADWLGFFSVSDMVWWYKKKYNIEL